jgi:hypothetical protein
MIIWHMRMGYLIPKVTDTHSGYVLFIVFHCSKDCANVVRTYIACSLIIYGPYELQSLNALGVTENTVII